VAPLASSSPLVKISWGWKKDSSMRGAFSFPTQTAMPDVRMANCVSPLIRRGAFHARAENV